MKSATDFTLFDTFYYLYIAKYTSNGPIFVENGPIYEFCSCAIGCNFGMEGLLYRWQSVTHVGYVVGPSGQDGGFFVGQLLSFQTGG